MQEGLETQESCRQFQYAYGIDDGVNPVQEKDGGTILVNILGGLGIDEVFMRTDSAGARNFLTDALGSTMALREGMGSSRWMSEVSRE